MHRFPRHVCIACAVFGFSLSTVPGFRKPHHALSIPSLVSGSGIPSLHRFCIVMHRRGAPAPLFGSTPAIRTRRTGWTRRTGIGGGARESLESSSIGPNMAYFLSRYWRMGHCHWGLYPASASRRAERSRTETCFTWATPATLRRARVMVSSICWSLTSNTISNVLRPFSSGM